MNNMQKPAMELVKIPRTRKLPALNDPYHAVPPSHTTSRFHTHELKVRGKSITAFLQQRQRTPCIANTRSFYAGVHNSRMETSIDKVIKPVKLCQNPSLYMQSLCVLSENTLCCTIGYKIQVWELTKTHSIKRFEEDHAPDKTAIVKTLDTNRFLSYSTFFNTVAIWYLVDDKLLKHELSPEVHAENVFHCEYMKCDRVISCSLKENNLVVWSKNISEIAFEYRELKIHTWGHQKVKGHTNSNIGFEQILALQSGQILSLTHRGSSNGFLTNTHKPELFLHTEQKDGTWSSHHLNKDIPDWIHMLQEGEHGTLLADIRNGKMPAIQCWSKNQEGTWSLKRIICPKHSSLVNGIRALSNDRLLTWDYGGELRVCHQKSEPEEQVSELATELATELKLDSRSDTDSELEPELKRLSEMYKNADKYWAYSDLSGHKEKINDAVELQSGNILSWSDDATIRLWNEQVPDSRLENKQEPDTSWKSVALVGKTSRHPQVEGVAILAPGYLISMAKYDSKFLLWDVSSVIPTASPPSTENQEA